MTHDARRIAVSAGVCGAAAVFTVAMVAGAVAWSGRGEDVRRALHFSFAGTPRSPSEVMEVAFHNGRLAAGALGLAVIAPRLGPRMRRAAHLLLAAVLGLNAGAVGVAVGAYGTRVLAAIAPHLPLELGGLCLAGGSCVQALREPLGLRTLATVAVGCTLSLIAAAALETFVSGRWLP